jgi:hypothetical protein
MQGNMKIANWSIEYVAQFRYLGVTATNQNFVQEKYEEESELG